MSTTSKVTSRTPLILVVDDDPEMRGATVGVLERSGYAVLQGANAAEAVALARSHHPDLILLDVVLPDGDGRDVAKQLKTDPELAGIFVVLLSGVRISEEDQSAGLTEGLADGYIVHPVSPKVLRGWVEAFLRLRTTQDALRRSESELADAQALAHVGNWHVVFREGGDVWSGSKELHRMYGYPPDVHMATEMVLGRIHPDDRERTALIWADCLRGEGPQEWEHRIVVDGQVKWIHVQARFQFDDAGRPIEAGGTHLDITARKRAEQALQEKAEEIYDLYNHAPCGYHSLDSDGLVVRMNDTELKWLGYRQEEVVGKINLADLLTLQSRLIFRECFPRFKSTGMITCLELEMVRKDGSRLPILVNATAIKDSAGKYVMSRSSVHDITERKQLEEKIAELNRDFVSFLENTSDFIYFKDENGRIRFCSNTLANITGHRSWRELIGKHDLEIFPADTARIYCEEELPIFQHGRPLLNKEDPYYDASGKKGIVSTNKWPLLNSEGEVVGLFGISRDITALKQANEEKERLEVQNRQLQKAESLGRMAGAIAHHFNNKLQAVMMCLDLATMAKSMGFDPGTNLANAMEAAREAAEVSTLMLTYLGQSQATHEPLDLSETCRRLLSLLRTTLPQNVDLQTYLSSPGPVIDACANQIQQILTNLLTNAREAMGDKEGSVRLTVKTVSAVEISSTHRFPIDWRPEGDNYACLEIADTGCGIPEEHFETLFEPFFSTKFTGRGLGLPAVLGIVRSHTGVIAVESHPGRGSTFRVFLPATTMELPRKLVPAVPSPVMAVSGTVLVVEDEISVRNTLTTALMILGYKTLKAEDGKEAVEIFKQHKEEIDCVLTDLTMPRMDGWKVLEAVRKLKPGVPVILSSGYSESQVLAGEHTELPQALLGKPYMFEELKETMMRVMTKRVEY